LIVNGLHNFVSQKIELFNRDNDVVMFNTEAPMRRDMFVICNQIFMLFNCLRVGVVVARQRYHKARPLCCILDSSLAAPRWLIMDVATAWLG
jgi:hypothetical protein